MKRSLAAAGLFVAAVLVVAVPFLHGPSEGLRWILASTLALSASTLIVRSSAANVALMLASVGWGLVALEGLALILEKPAPTWIDDGLSARRDFVGYGPKHAGVYHEREVARDGHVIFDANVTIGSDLLRIVQARKGDGAISFFGDSWTFGTGVDDGDTITQAFADLTGRAVPVLNQSFSGWSPAQNLATLQHGLNEDEMRGARRFVLMTAAWHIERTACKVDFVRFAPRYRLVDGRLVQDGACFVPGRLHDALRSFAIYRTIVARVLNRPTKRDFETYMAIVDAFVRLAKARYGADTTIIAMPFVSGQLERMGSSQPAYLDALARTGADVLVDPLPMGGRNNPYVIGDGFHPNGRANRYVAKLLYDHLAARSPALLPKAAQAAP